MVGLCLKEPSFSIRGVVEGFYGPPWSHEVRLSLLGFFHECRFNIYIYAPKDDPFHRQLWREPYPPSGVEKFKALIDASRRASLNFCFAISPGLSIKYSSDDDFKALTRKVEAFLNMGVRWFGLFLDDVPMELQYEDDRRAFKSLAEAQASLTNKLLQFLKSREPEASLILCPTQYTGVGPSPYLETLGSQVDQNIFIMWTGRAVCSEEITCKDAMGFGAAIRRKPFIWDNYPVNDYNRFRLFLGPIRGRSKNLYKYVSGYVSNPMNEGEASKVPLLTIADYLLDPENYDPEASWDKAVRKVAGEEAYKALKTFVEQSQSSFLWKAESPKLKEKIERFWGGWDSDLWRQELNTLKNQFQELAELKEFLKSTLKNRLLVNEISPYLDKLTLLSKAGILSLEILNKQKKAKTDIEFKEIQSFKKALEDLKKKCEEYKHQVCGTIIMDFIDKTLTLT